MYCQSVLVDLESSSLNKIRQFVICCHLNIVYVHIYCAMTLTTVYLDLIQTIKNSKWSKKLKCKHLSLVVRGRHKLGRESESINVCRIALCERYPGKCGTNPSGHWPIGIWEREQDNMAKNKQSNPFMFRTFNLGERVDYVYSSLYLSTERLWLRKYKFLN